jgi:NifU-like protein involved in Fe-S cluster formation
MADLDDVYNLKILELASDIPHSGRLAHADATASARSKLCGSTIEIDLMAENGRITAFGQDVKACLLGQAAAAIVGREIVGTTCAEFTEVGAVMRRMLKEGGSPPQGRWEDLALLQPVKDYPHRHASTLLVFDAVDKAIAEIAGTTAPAPASP